MHRLSCFFLPASGAFHQIIISTMTVKFLGTFSIACTDINQYRPVDMNDVQPAAEDVSILSHGTFMLAECLKQRV